MTAHAAPPDSLAGLFPGDLALGDPDVAGPLTIYPLLATPGALEYRSFAEAVAHGFVVKELDQVSVNDLLAVNPLDVPVLLFEGEEVKGAQQDRTLDVTVLVAAGATVKVPVSCVEHGRWDGARRGEAFTPSPQSAFPALRAAKNRRVRESLAETGEARADQGEVWDEVNAKLAEHDAESETGAMGDVYAHRREGLAELESRVSRRDGQLGAIACIGGRPLVLDYVSRPDVFAALWPPLLRGYCLDALEQREADAPREVAEDFLGSVGTASSQRRPGLGLGETLAFAGAQVGGSGLAVGPELVQLSAFADDGGSMRAGRILRPSRRRT